MATQKRWNSTRIALWLAVSALAFGGAATIRAADAAHVKNAAHRVAHRLQRSTNSPVLQAVSAQELTQNFGITLEAPDAASSIGKAAAWGVALRAPSTVPGTTVLQAVLARLRTPTNPRLDRRLVWIFSVQRPGAQSASDGYIMHLKYELLFVDALTGQFAGGIAAGPTTPQRTG